MPRFALPLVLAAAGVVEVLLVEPRAVSVVAVLVATVSLGWRREAPLLPLAAVALALIVDSALDGVLVGRTAVALVALAIALYSVGRYAGELGLVGGALGAVVVTATRVLADPAVDSAGHAVLTLVAVSMPLLAGRWVRGQTLLQRRFVERAARLERDRDRDTRAAAEEERMRIAGDLHAAIAGRLHDIVAAADPERIDRSTLAAIADDARDALADVRRVLGILRRDGEAPLTPAVVPGEVVTVEDAPMAAAEDEGGGDDRVAIIDRVLAAAVLVGATVELTIVDSAAAALTGVLVAVPLLFRRRTPLLAAAGVFTAAAVQSATLDLESFPVSDIAAVVIASYSIAAFEDRRTALAGLAGALAFAAAHAAIVYPDGLVAALLGGVAAPWIAGRVVRGQRELTAQGREEAAAAEMTKRRDARAAVTAERMRVARELHDAVAHNISVIAIQAGGADGILDKDPARTREIVTLIAAVAREALAELNRLVGGVDEAPCLAEVDALAARAREAGQTVELTVEGEPKELPRGLDLAAYRIVQEALANAAKHAAGAPARVLVRYDARALDIEVADEGGAAKSSENGGHGLIGIEERVALYGGTLQIGARPRGGFQVKARLPIT